MKDIIYKTVSDSVADRIQSGYIRIGSLQYYKNIEDTNRQDNQEGIPNRQIGGEGKIITADEFNDYAKSVGSIYRMKSPYKIEFKGSGSLLMESDWNIHIFCASQGTEKTVEKQTHFGKQIFEIINPHEFSEIIAFNIHSEYKKGNLKPHEDMDSISFIHKSVKYQDGKENINYILKDNEPPKINLDAAFTKSLIYQNESEYRFIWCPFSNKKQIVCSLPYGHHYIDLKINGLGKQIRWLK